MDPCQLCYEWILLAVCSDSTAAAEQTLPCSGTDNIWRRGGLFCFVGSRVLHVVVQPSYLRVGELWTLQVSQTVFPLGLSVT